MLKDFIEKGKAKIGAFLDKVRVGGFTVPSILKRNRDNTKKALFEGFKGAVMSGVDTSTYSQSLEKVIKSRKRSVLNTLKNTYSAVRGQGRAIMASGKKGYWANAAVLDGRTTPICASHAGRTWQVSYSEIPNKPPRIPPSHPCRSYLYFVVDGSDISSEEPFMTQFNADESLQKELLGPKRFEAMKAGRLPINSFAQYEKSVLNTLEELELDNASRAANFAKASQPVAVVPVKSNLASVDLPVDIPSTPKPAQTKPRYTSEEVGRIEYYKGDGFYEMNRRVLDPDKYSAGQVAEAKAMTRSIDDIIDKSKTTKDHVFYRGLESEDLFNLDESSVGVLLPNRTTQSTTYNRRTADTYAGVIGDLSAVPGKSVILKINVKKGSSALNPAELTSINSGEYEVMLKANSQYKIKSVVTQGQLKIIEVDYL